MNNETVNRILQSGLDEIDDLVSLHEEIREVAKELTQQLLWDQAISEYIVDEYGQEHPYHFILERGVDTKNGTPIINVYVINVHNMEYASQIQGKQYRPAKYSAPLEGEFSTEETVQTILSTAIAAIKGVVLIDEIEEEE